MTDQLTLQPSSTLRFKREVADRFGVLPNFFCSADSAPGLVEELWKFAKSADLDSPLPSLFKERLFIVTAAIEAGAGLALLVMPAVAIRWRFGARCRWLSESLMPVVGGEAVTSLDGLWACRSLLSERGRVGSTC